MCAIHRYQQPQRPKEHIRPPGTEPKSTGRAAGALSHRAISAALQTTVLKKDNYRNDSKLLLNLTWESSRDASRSQKNEAVPNDSTSLFYN